MSARFHLDLANRGSLNCNLLRSTTLFIDFINLNRFCLFQGQDFFEIIMSWVEINFDAKERTLVCSAEDCRFVSKDLEQFIQHVKLHQPVIEQPGTFNCPFKMCKKSLTNMDAFVCHQGFHLHEIRALSVGWEEFVNFVDNDSPDVQWQLSCMGKRKYSYNFDDSPMICKWNDCKKTFLDFTKYAEHVQKHMHDELQVYSLYICQWEGCNKEINGTGNMKCHINSHTKYRPYCCPGCGQFYALLSSFKKHLMTTTAKEKDKYQCTRCGKSFPYQCLLRRHFFRHVLAVTCDICGLMLHSASNLEIHKTRVHQTLMRHFPCPECQKLFKFENDLKEHMIVHSDNFPHTCDQCGKKFKRKSELSRHSEIHQNRKYICYLCPAEYKRSCMLSRHLKYFHNIKPQQGRGKFNYVRLEEEGVYGMQKDDLVFDRENEEE
ncbi:Zinc finger protein [Trichinella papuae]|uniref:Zinc finger protein n=1 Tax=Trichinella papuae TaxID=268474 RepID=A0A0V1MRI9_9BILA|nr:Zinc finger protein [Trichinella papuae]